MGANLNTRIPMCKTPVATASTARPIQWQQANTLALRGARQRCLDPNLTAGAQVWAIIHSVEKSGGANNCRATGYSDRGEQVRLGSMPPAGWAEGVCSVRRQGGGSYACLCMKESWEACPCAGHQRSRPPAEWDRQGCSSGGRGCGARAQRVQGEGGGRNKTGAAIAGRAGS